MADPLPLPLPVARYDADTLPGLLAHRYPILLVDRIDVMARGQRVVGHRQVTGNEWATGGVAGFGGAGWEPGLPGVLVVEALAQTSAALLVDLVDTSAGVVGYFAGLERVRLRGRARAGETLALEVTLRAFKRGVAKLRGAARVVDDGRVVATADFTTVVRPRG
ncbi:3-hydroxyacyl-ACP dehydratase FabZ family protein [Roseisolibacter sp. H3M3-2]|uniref:3-hydroxyacyl-ACP dehydratase FabZ family protein n=1 Tax=Roseisolibacter sp. H3M3-2 TaxID=3031323 RepID=UPI0023DAB270|nr:3-hydroxyacyl-ACP dehydratase FabZ family protein [Roseisolibacter sp. H3M3-2]MDF1502537.1 beta-hydroxyacyl-ACP dehydratase [Roseisolibacter sp. H3M3-2]